MKLKMLLPGFVVFVAILTGCKTEHVVQIYEPSDANAVLIRSVEGGRGQVLGEGGTRADAENSELLNNLRGLTAHHTAVVMLEHYSEPEPDLEFRDRATPWFLALRLLGFEHIIFLRGQSVDSPAGLTVVASYD
jgi:hypothetical protein